MLGKLFLFRLSGRSPTSTYIVYIGKFDSATGEERWKIRKRIIHCPIAGPIVGIWVESSKRFGHEVEAGAECQRKKSAQNWILVISDHTISLIESTSRWKARDPGNPLEQEVSEPSSSSE